jgi:hypothetical protein
MKHQAPSALLHWHFYFWRWIKPNLLEIPITFSPVGGKAYPVCILFCPAEGAFGQKLQGRQKTRLFVAKTLHISC